MMWRKLAMKQMMASELVAAYFSRFVFAFMVAMVPLASCVAMVLMTINMVELLALVQSCKKVPRICWTHLLLAASRAGDMSGAGVYCMHAPYCGFSQAWGEGEGHIQLRGGGGGGGGG